MTPDPSSAPARPERVAADVAPTSADVAPTSADAGSPSPVAGPALAADGSATAPPAKPEEMCELGGQLLEQGQAAQAAEVFTAALQLVAADDPVRGHLLSGLGMARLEQAVMVFTEAAQHGDHDARPLALELLARVLPLRERDEQAAQVWQHGLNDPDPHVVAAVRARLRRAFGVVAEPGQEFWWDSFLESAVRDGTLPVLAAELFGALDQLYALVAVPYVRKVRQRELREALAQAVRLPGGYAWGPELQQSFRRRLGDRDGM